MWSSPIGCVLTSERQIYMNDHLLSTPPTFENKYFASANSAQGFKNDFPRCFSVGNGIDLLYIIKGGPGTGKSHLLRTLGRCAEAHGYATTYYCCSSDPTSLDGLLVQKAGEPTLGFVDGTAPHIWEPTLPGVKEEMINLGIFWKGHLLQTKKEEIKALDHQKETCYTLTYHDLAACGEAIAAADLLITPCIKAEKLNGLACRLAKGLAAGKIFTEHTAHTQGVGMKGCVRFDTYEQLAAQRGGEIICIDACYGLGHRLLSRIYERAKEKGAHVMVSHDPVMHQKIDGLYDMNSHTCFLVGLSDCPHPHRRVSLHRYLDADAFRSVRGEVRHRLKLAEDMKNCACESMKKAGAYHFALENIYAAAMDFKAKDQFDKALCRRLFGE